MAPLERDARPCRHSTLAFLWLAVLVLTVVAGFAILFTGRYPRGIVDLNVGVMRWTRRVPFDAINAFATDRNPPWSLRSDPSYPADLTIDYPRSFPAVAPWSSGGCWRCRSA